MKTLTSRLLLLCCFLLPLCVSAWADEIDSPEYWADGRKQITRLGDGFLVWEAHRDDHWSIWTIQLDGTGLKQLTPVENDRDQFCPKISPDGKTVAYLSMHREDIPGDPGKSPLHLINADGTGDHIIVPDAHKYGASWDRAVVWFSPTRLAYIGADNRTYMLDLPTGKSELLINDSSGWLPNTALTNVVTSFNTFSLLDAKTMTVTFMPHLGGCMPYFTQDGHWGFWMANMGGPIGKMRLSTREWSPFLDPSIMPKERNYCYFPNVSSSQCLLAFGAANHEKLRGGYGGYVLSDYNIFLVQIDPNTLEILGKPVRYTYDPVCNRFPDAYQPPPALGFKSNKAPFTVDFPSPAPGEWTWDFGDGATAKGPTAAHNYDKPGVFIVSAVQGGVSKHGIVRVLPAKAPKAQGAALEGERTLLVTFDEAVNLDKASIKLASGAAIEKVTLSPDGRSMRLLLAKKPAQADALQLANITDQAQHPATIEPTTLNFAPRLWPAVTQGTLFAWETANKPNQLIEPASGQLSSCSFQASDNAVLDEHYALRTIGGSFMARNFGTQFGGAVQKSNAFSIEMTVTPLPASDTRERALCSNYNILMRGDKLIYREGNVEMCALPPNKPTHVVVTYTPGQLICYLNGTQVSSSNRVTTDLRGQRGYALLVGNDLDNRPWYGTVEGIALFGRVLSPEEARAEADAYRAICRDRKLLAPVELDATLTAASRPPKLAEITPYRQALVVNEYAVNHVISGTLAAKTIRVAHWVILNEQTLDVTQLPLNAPVHLTVAPFDANPQLAGENMTDTLPESDAPLYYAVTATWDHHAAPCWSAVTGFQPKPQDINIEHGKWDPDPGMNEVYPPETQAAPFICYGDGLPDSFKGGHWQLVTPADDGYVNLFQLTDKSGANIGYAVAYVSSPVARQAILRVGAVGACKVWVNGKQALAGRIGRYPFLGYREEPITLAAGWNQILIKTTQLYAFWGFSCDLLNTDGKLLSDLHYSATKPNGTQSTAHLLMLAGVPNFLQMADQMNAKKTRVACVGDSITATPFNYPTALQALLGNDYVVENFGVGGTTMFRHSDAAYAKQDAFTKATEFNPEIVIVALGTNDTDSKYWPQFKQEFAADTKAMLDHFAALPTHPRLFVCLPAPVYGGYATVEQNLREALPLLVKEAKAAKATVIDLHTALQDYPELYADGCHPDPPATAMIARVIYQQMLGAPQVSEPSGLFYDKLTVRLTLDQPGAEIHYTLDGAPPTDASPIYKKPLTISETTTLNAIVIAQKSPSPLITRTYTKVTVCPATTVDKPRKGLAYKYYENDDDQALMDMAKLTPKKEGIADSCALTFNDRREDWAGTFTGYLAVPRDGVYTFWAASDDGSTLDIDGARVVENDGIHGTWERHGQIALAAGYHPITLRYYQCKAGYGLQVSWQGPGIEKQEIPAGVIFH